jgi:hypothetical protein
MKRWWIVPVTLTGLLAGLGVASSAVAVADPGLCTDPELILDGWEGQGLGEYYADGNMWNSDGYEIDQTMGVCSYNSWYVDVNAADHQDGAVLSYPNTHRDYHDWSTGEEPRIDTFSAIWSRFGHDAGGNSGIYNVAYDLWLNGVASPGSTELMIWTENSGQVPAGDEVATVTIVGHDWDLWVTEDNQYIAFVAADGPVTSGRFNLKKFTDYLMVNGRLPQNSTLGQIDYGVEIVSTHGEDLHFDFTNFSANAVPK